MLKQGKNVIFDTYIYYTMINQPQLMWNRKATDKPFENKEYSVRILLTEQDYKGMKKRFPMAKSLKEVKEMSREEFVKAFKVEPPYEAEDDVYYILKMTRIAFYKKDGEGIPEKARPTAQFVSTREPLGETLIGNGTKAHVQFNPRSWNHNGTDGITLDLQKIGVIDLVEYKAKESNEWEDDDYQPEESSSNSEGDSKQETDNGDDDW